MRRYIIILLLFLGIICFLFLPYERAVVIENGESNKLLAYIPIQLNERFHIQYTHSIHLSTVKESYVVLQDGRIRQIELMYEDTAIGMPANADAGEIFTMEDGAYFIKNMRRNFPSIYMRLGQVVANHQLIVREEIIPFSSIIEAGELVKIHSRKLTLWEIWRGEKIDGRRGET